MGTGESIEERLAVHVRFGGVEVRGALDREFGPTGVVAVIPGEGVPPHGPAAIDVRGAVRVTEVLPRGLPGVRAAFDEVGAGAAHSVADVAAAQLNEEKEGKKAAHGRTVPGTLAPVQLDADLAAPYRPRPNLRADSSAGRAED